MRQIVMRCHTPNLDRLTLEYCADVEDNDFLSRLTTSFPRLTFLELYRHRPSDTVDVPLVSMFLNDTWAIDILIWATG